MDKRKQYTGVQKAQMLREVIEEGKSLSEVAEANQVHPNMMFKWRKRLLEAAPEIFEAKRPDISGKAEERKTAALQAELAQKDAVIADLAQELLALKKKNSGLTSGR
jgi:transposase-like protein